MPIYSRIRDFDQSVTVAVILCARQFGKSFLGLVLAIEDCLRYRDKCILIVGPTIKQTRDIVFPRVRQIARTAPKGLIKQLKSEDKFLIGDCELVIGGFDNRASSHQRGKSVQNIYIEEIVDSKPDDYSEVIRSDLAPALMHSDDGRITFLTTPPKIPDHPFLIDTVPGARMAQSLFVYTIDDNHQLTKQQYDRNIELAGGVDSIECQRELFCKTVRDTSLVCVPHYDDNKHVSDRIKVPSDVKWQVDIDWGGVVDKTAVLLHYYDPLLGKRVIWDEVAFENNTATGCIVKEAKKMEMAHNAHKPDRQIDSAGQILVDLVNEYGYEGAFPRKGKWNGMLKELDDSFYNDEIVIHPRCTFLRETLRSGVLTKNRKDFERTLTLGHCDAIAALMYGNLREKQQLKVVPVAQFPQNMFTPVATPPEMARNYVTPKKFGVYRR